MSDIILVPPATESLVKLDEDSFWPKEILHDPKIRAQAKLRTDLLEALNKPPDKHLYNLLADFLEADSLHRRIILYLPFELLPHKSFALKRFVETYRNYWYQSLSTCDVAENFIDGDVLEEELRTEPLERVVKAAHLIPHLLEKKLIFMSEICELIVDNPDSVLEKGIWEALGIKKRRKENENLPPEKISLARAKWLAKKNKFRKIMDRKFGVHWPEIKQEVARLIDLCPIILYGSRLKGYGTAEDDLDYIKVSKIKKFPDWTHVLFGGAWYDNFVFLFNFKSKTLKFFKKKSITIEMSIITSFYSNL